MKRIAIFLLLLLTMNLTAIACDEGQSEMAEMAREQTQEQGDTTPPPADTGE